MRLIGLAVVFTVSLFFASIAADGLTAKVPRVAILSTGNPRSTPIFKAFEQRLRDLGYVDGQNLAIEFRNAEGRTDRLPGLAAEHRPARARRDGDTRVARPPATAT